MGSIFIFLIITSLLLLLIPKITITLNGEKEIFLNVGEEYIEKGAEAYIKGFGKKEELSVTIKGELDTNKIGNYLITYYAKSRNIKADAIRRVIVADLEKPSLTLKNPILFCKNNNLIEIDAEAMDNLDGDITDKIKYKVNNNKIYIYVSDSSNNKTEIVQDVIYNDDDKPSIKLNGSKEINLNIGDPYLESGATAYDSCDGNITDKIEIIGGVDSNISGEYNITYKVKDNQGNIAIETRKIIVSEKSNIANNNGIIYLTFDDGPGPYTEQILEILEKNNIKATFFVTNQLGSKYQYLIKKEYDAGHTVGIHTYSHVMKSIYDSVDAYLNDFEKIRKIVADQTGVEPKYFRFPGGTSNHVAKTSMSELSKLMLEKGYVYFDWHTSVEDAGSCTKKKGDTEKEKCILNNFKNGLNNNNANNIVLMHDIKKNTMHVLQEMISYAKSKGYTFKVIDETTPLKQFKPYN